MAHPEEAGPGGVALERHRDRADAFLQIESGGVFGEQPVSGQDPGGADGGMPGELELAGGGEDPHPRRTVAARGRQDEGRLGEIHLLGDGLHLAVRQAGGFEDDRQGIAPEYAVGEDVDLDEAVRALGHAAAYEYIEKSTAFSVMNSRSAGVPSCVCLIARLMAGTISAGSVTRSPWPPKALAMSA